MAADHDGLFIQAGLYEVFDTGMSGTGGLFVLGPGAHFGIGYNMGTIGIRPSFYYGSLGNNVLLAGGSSDIFGGSLDGLIYFLDLMNYKNDWTKYIEPYLVFGVGGYHVSAGDLPAFGGRAGFGFNLNISDSISFGVETGIRPLLLVSGGSSTDLILYDLMGMLTFRPGSK